MTKLAEGVKRVGRPVLAVDTETTIDSFDVLWNGANFVVAGTNGWNVVGRLLDRDGEPLANEFTLMSEARDPRLAFNGSTLLLLYRRHDIPQTGVLRLTKNATPAGSDEQLIPAGDTAIASDGRGFAAITAANKEVRLTIFDANGIISSTESLTVTAHDERQVAIASDGTRYFAAWVDDAGGVTTMINSGHAGRRVPFTQESGRNLRFSFGDVVRLYIRAGVRARDMGPGDGDDERFRTGDQGRVLMAWNRDEDAVVEMLPDGTLSDAWSTFGAANQKLLAAVGNDTSTLVVWSEIVNGVSSVYAGRQDESGNWSERLLANRTIHHAIAGTDGTNFVVLATKTRT